MKAKCEAVRQVGRNRVSLPRRVYSIMLNNAQTRACVLSAANLAPFEGGAVSYTASQIASFHEGGWGKLALPHIYEYITICGTTQVPSVSKR